MFIELLQLWVERDSSVLKFSAICKYKRYSESGLKCTTTHVVNDKKESNHWILFSLHKEIIEDSYSLWLPRKGIPI